MKATKLALLSLPVLFLLTLTLGAVVVGCSSEAVISSEATVAMGTDVQPTTATAQPTTTNVSEIVTTTTTTTPPPSATTGYPRYSEAQPGETRLENGNMAGLGYIDHINYMGPDYRTIYVAYVEVLTGEEAKAAAIEDGVLQPGEELSDDYYIHKTAELPETVVSEQMRWETPARVLAPDASITTFTLGDGGEQEITWDQFSSFFGWAGQTPPEGGEHLRDAIWYVERNETGDAVIIREYVLP